MNTTFRNNLGRSIRPSFFVMSYTKEPIIKEEKQIVNIGIRWGGPSEFNFELPQSSFPPQPEQPEIHDEDGDLVTDTIDEEEELIEPDEPIDELEIEIENPFGDESQDNAPFDLTKNSVYYTLNRQGSEIYRESDTIKVHTEEDENIIFEYDRPKTLIFYTSTFDYIEEEAIPGRTDAIRVNRIYRMNYVKFTYTLSDPEEEISGSTSFGLTPDAVLNMVKTVNSDNAIAGRRDPMVTGSDGVLPPDNIISSIIRDLKKEWDASH